MPQEGYRPRPVPPNTGGTRTFHGLPVPAQRQSRAIERRPSAPPPPWMTENNPIQAPPETNIPLEPNYKQIPPSAYEGPFGLPQPPPYEGPMPPTNNPPVRPYQRPPQVMGYPGPVDDPVALRQLMDRAQFDPSYGRQNPPPSQRPSNPFAPPTGGR